MAHRKRRRPKQQRNGCLLCKPWKLPASKKSMRRASQIRADVDEREQRGG